MYNPAIINQYQQDPMWQFIMQGIKKPTDSGNGSSSSSTLPNLNNPNVSTPSVSGPNISGPNITAPSISTPNINLSAPSISAPAVNLPSLPSIQTPDLGIQTPSLSLPSIPLPSIDTSSLNLPSVPLPSTGGIGYSNGQITYNPTPTQAINTAEDIANIIGQPGAAGTLSGIGSVLSSIAGPAALADFALSIGNFLGGLDKQQFESQNISNYKAAMPTIQEDIKLDSLLGLTPDQIQSGLSDWNTAQKAQIQSGFYSDTSGLSGANSLTDPVNNFKDRLTNDVSGTLSADQSNAILDQYLSNIASGNLSIGANYFGNTLPLINYDYQSGVATILDPNSYNTLGTFSPNTQTQQTISNAYQTQAAANQAAALAASKNYTPTNGIHLGVNGVS